MNLISKLKRQKHSWKAFTIFFEQYPNFTLVEFERLNFLFQCGVFIKFLEHYGLDLLSSFYCFIGKEESITDYERMIKEGFEVVEKQLNGT